MSDSEYSPGSVLHLKSAQDGTPIAVTIVHAYTPFTMSPVLKVSIGSDGAAFLGTENTTEMILKLYDRRHLANVREEFGDTDPIEYTPHKQESYVEYLATIQSGEKEVIDFADKAKVGEMDLSDGEFEGYVAHWTNKFHEAELRTYEHLQPLQGTRIPRLYSAVVYPRAEGIPDPVPGLLLEYIPSLSLRQFIRHDPPYSPELVRGICDDAMKLINDVNDHEVLNEDVRLDNVLVRLSSLHSGEETRPACVLIDLSHCRQRRPDESEEEWVQAKWSQDEEGAVGYIAQREVQNEYLGEKGEKGNVWTYKPSLRYYQQA